VCCHLIQRYLCIIVIIVVVVVVIIIITHTHTHTSTHTHTHTHVLHYPRRKAYAGFSASGGRLVSLEVDACCVLNLFAYFHQ
jgi:amino acid transporter